MPNESAHIGQANRNDDALRYLVVEGSRFPEWITTIAFYKAVHVVEALLFHQHTKNSHDHISRLSTLRGLYPNLYKHFRPLYAASMVARYLCDNDGDGKSTTYLTFTDYISADDVINKIVYRRLVPLEQIALGLLSDSAKKQLTKTQIPPQK